MRLRIHINHIPTLPQDPKHLAHRSKQLYTQAHDRMRHVRISNQLADKLSHGFQVDHVNAVERLVIELVEQLDDSHLVGLPVVDRSVDGVMDLLALVVVDLLAEVMVVFGVAQGAEAFGGVGLVDDEVFDLEGAPGEADGHGVLVDFVAVGDTCFGLSLRHKSIQHIRILRILKQQPYRFTIKQLWHIGSNFVINQHMVLRARYRHHTFENAQRLLKMTLRLFLR